MSRVVKFAATQLAITWDQEDSLAKCEATVREARTRVIRNTVFL